MSIWVSLRPLPSRRHARQARWIGSAPRFLTLRPKAQATYRVGRDPAAWPGLPRDFTRRNLAQTSQTRPFPRHRAARPLHRIAKVSLQIAWMSSVWPESQHDISPFSVALRLFQRHPWPDQTVVPAYRCAWHAPDRRRQHRPSGKGQVHDIKEFEIVAWAFLPGDGERTQFDDRRDGTGPNHGAVPSKRKKCLDAGIAALRGFR